ncbi:MAG: hypothetical protein ACR2PX_23185 [Endozoicomonas sp.]|uniref:hypothetical protein n=1 Tax=Endozoicomonas sp. TaxID=1892382 RepID=UPI003D9AE075
MSTKTKPKESRVKGDRKFDRLGKILQEQFKDEAPEFSNDEPLEFFKDENSKKPKKGE